MTSFAMRMPRARAWGRPSGFLFFFNDTATTEIYTLSLHDALPICRNRQWPSLGNLGRQVASADELHDQIMPDLGLVGVVCHHDVRMAGPGNDFDLALESLHEGG